MADKRGSLGDFRPPTLKDWPGQDPKLFEILDTTFKTLRDVVRLLQGKLGPSNLNWEILQKDLFPSAPTILELELLRGPPLGALPLLVDVAVGSRVTGFGMRVIDERHVEVSLDVTPPQSTPRALFSRILVVGS